MPFVNLGTLPPEPSFGEGFGGGFSQGAVRGLERRGQEEQTRRGALSTVLQMWYNMDETGRSALVESPGWSNVEKVASEMGIPFIQQEQYGTALVPPPQGPSPEERRMGLEEGKLGLERDKLGLEERKLNVLKSHYERMDTIAAQRLNTELAESLLEVDEQGQERVQGLYDNFSDAHTQHVTNLATLAKIEDRQGVMNEMIANFTATVQGSVGGDGMITPEASGLVRGAGTRVASQIVNELLRAELDDSPSGLSYKESLLEALTLLAASNLVEEDMYRTYSRWLQKSDSYALEGESETSRGVWTLKDEEGWMKGLWKSITE
jgi:hypothetical protein